MRHITIPEEFFKELNYEIEFDWESYRLLQLFNAMTRHKAVINQGR